MNDTTPANSTEQPAVGAPVEASVRPLAAQRATLGDTIIRGVRNPYPRTISMRLDTLASVAYANKLLVNKRSGWRLVEFAERPNAAVTGLQRAAHRSTDEHDE